MEAQILKGHVCVFSTTDSFGEKLFKIGLTKSLECEVKNEKLVNVSFLLMFDVYVILFTEDISELEKELNEAFNLNRINKVDYRTGFYSISMHEIKHQINRIGLKAHYTMKATSLEYSESI